MERKKSFSKRMPNIRICCKKHVLVLFDKILNIFTIDKHNLQKPGQL